MCAYNGFEVVIMGIVYVYDCMRRNSYTIRRRNKEGGLQLKA